MATAGDNFTLQAHSHPAITSLGSKTSSRGIAGECETGIMATNTWSKYKV